MHALEDSNLRPTAQKSSGFPCCNGCRLARQVKLLLAFIASVLAIAMTLSGGAVAQVSNSALEFAGRHATLRTIDYGEDHCDGEVTVDAWLKALVGAQARAIRWTGGQCELAGTPSPIDAASWPFCAQATIILVHPKAKNDRPFIEIYLEKPVHGRPGAAYAFRSAMMTRDDGPDLERSRKDFESEWDERYPPSNGTTRCQD